MGIGCVHVNNPLLILRPGLEPGEDEHQQSAPWSRTGWEQSEGRAGSYLCHPAGTPATRHIHRIYLKV